MKNNNWKKKAFGKKTNENTKQLQINFFLIDKYKIGIQIPFGYCLQEIKNFIRFNADGIWDMENKCWVINRQGYDKVVQKFQQFFFNLNNNQEKSNKIVKVNPIEDFVFKIQKMLQQELEEIYISSLKPYSNIRLKYNSIQTKIQPESLPFYNKLFDFQKQSLKFGIHKHGRILLADEMGVGKTIQSLAIAYIYKHQWPMLIICPPTLKINWQNQIKRWYPDIQPTQVQLINTSKTAFRVNVSIMIISYDLAWRMKEMFDHVKVVIADQAHYLKSSDSKRSQILVPFLSTRKRVILLTGTPAFARPRQIFNLINIVRPNLFKNFKAFGNRYCEPKWNHWSHTYEYNGCKNVKQLHYILKQNIMIRRLKSEVLKQLPDKNRQKIILQTDPGAVRQIKQLLEKNNINKIQTFFSQFIGTASSYTQESHDKRQQLMQAYRLSGMAKIKAVKQYISEILQNDIKILVFAHHIKVLDEIESELKNKKHKFMRIDGKVSQVERANNVQKFQNDPEIMVALLSITAASVGLTLTASSTVIFAELHWTPALMIQAQDRAHRVGQKDSVNCHYLLGQNTIDQMLYAFLEKKVLNVSSFVDGQKKDLEFQSLKKGQIGKFSKRQQQSYSRKPGFGSSLLGRDYSQIQIDNQGISEGGEATDISQSTYDINKISRKRAPCMGTLDNFVAKRSKARSTILQQKQEYVSFKQNQDDQEKNYRIQSNSQKNYQEKIQRKYEDQEQPTYVRRSIQFNDYWDENQQKVQRKTQIKQSQKNRSTKNPQSQLQPDSDQQFQKILEYICQSKKISPKKQQNYFPNIDITQSIQRKQQAVSNKKETNYDGQECSNISSSSIGTKTNSICHQQKEYEI